MASKTYHIWYSMVWRCKQTKGYYYKYYGSRGIKVCDRWLKLENFIADLGSQPAGMSLERIDNSKGYNPSNCKWATMKEQGNNRRNNHYITIDGITKTVAQWISGNEKLRVLLHRKGERAFIERVKSLQVQ